MNIRVYPEQKLGKIKPMHAVNNGPVIARNDQTTGNGRAYAAARIPYARNHDASFCSSYGGAHTVDITAIFPNFDADENDPASYDFHLTDEYIQKTWSVGTETFFRLGQKIEHETKKYGIYPPKDFTKWAHICEHIIRHINEGWADGTEANLTYWEIWNEPDLDPDNAPNPRCWAGTEAQFFDLYEITAKHLKKCFPNLKIGGPALAHRLDWADRFLAEMKKRGVELDFFSWHIYSAYPEKIIERANYVDALLKKHGYTNTESILNEYNYVRGWTSEFVYSLKAISNYKGAAFFADTMLRAQQAPVDMLMYYDARPSGFNGLFAPYTYECQKPYHALCMFSDLYALGTEFACEVDDEEIHAVGATDGKACGLMFSFYTEDDTRCDTKTVTVTLPGTKASIKVLDKTKNAKAKTVKHNGTLTLEIRPNTTVYIAF